MLLKYYNDLAYLRQLAAVISFHDSEYFDPPPILRERGGSLRKRKLIVLINFYCFLSQEEINVCRTEFRYQLPSKSSPDSFNGPALTGKRIDQQNQRWNYTYFLGTISLDVTHPANSIFGFA